MVEHFHGKEGVIGSSPIEGFVVFASILGNFGVCAARGDPNAAGLAFWPAFTESQPLVMRFGFNPGPAPMPGQERLKVLDAYYDWRRQGSP